MYQFVLWGYGKRGKRFFEFCKKEHIKAIIDTNINLQGSIVENSPIISYEDYKNKYLEYDILITVEVYGNIINMLEIDNINNYFLLKECPHEFRGYQRELWFDKLPINIYPQHKYIIYGLNIYSMLLREYICEQIGSYEVGIVPETQKKEKAFSQKYDFIVSAQTFNNRFNNVEVLIACKACNMKLYKKIQNVFDFSYKFKENYSLEIAALKNKYRGEKCFIVATGPSIKIEDLEKLRKSNYICFGVNRIYLSFDKTEWRPEYLIATDEKMVVYYNEMLHWKVKNVIISDVLPNIAQEGRQKGAITIHLVVDEEGLPRFSVDPEWQVYGGGTVVYETLQLAVYMGFTEIYLLGTDHNYSENQSDQSNHFHKDYYSGISRPGRYFKERVELAYESAKIYAENHGVKIYNATRGGKLEIFERADFDLLMSKGDI